MGAHAAGVDFDTFDTWSAGAGNYDAAAARDVWRSIKPGRGVGAGTLYRKAAENGWRMDGKPQQRPPQATRKAAEPPRKPAPGMGPGEVWNRCEPATVGHPYIVAKGAAGVPIDLLRVVPAGDPLRIQGESMAGALVVPAFAPDGSLQSLQCVTMGETAARLKAKGKKPNRPLKNCFSNASGRLMSKTRAAQTRLRSDCNGPSGRFAVPPAHFGRTYPWAHA